MTEKDKDTESALTSERKPHTHGTENRMPHGQQVKEPAFPPPPVPEVDIKSHAPKATRIEENAVNTPAGQAEKMDKESMPGAGNHAVVGGDDENKAPEKS